MSQTEKDQQEPVIRHLIGLYEQALTTRNYHKADALHVAIQRAVKARPLDETARPLDQPGRGEQAPIPDRQHRSL